MSSRRIAKVAEALRETISMTVLFGLKDPRVKNVTVLRTEVSPDLKAARVYVSVMGDEKTQSLAMHGLRSARGFIQSQIADRLELRYTPILSFVLDHGVKLSIEASSIIRQALTTAGESTVEGDTGADETSEDHAESTGEETDGEETDGGAGDAPGSGLEQTTESTGI
ncbi:MAG TPA: 30S ribosome-binding factor RbfA [Planctomycetaceae bacterium]|jgi:ribosome-binding factor A